MNFLGGRKKDHFTGNGGGGEKIISGGDKFRLLQRLEERSPIHLEGSDSSLVGKIS